MTKIVATGLAGLLILLAGGCATTSRTNDPTRDWAAQRFYTEGQDALRAENYPQAIDYFKQMQRRYPGDERALPSQLEIAYAWYKLDNTDEAVDAANHYIDAPGSQPHVDYAFYLKGLARYQAAMHPADTGTAAGQVQQTTGLRDAFHEFANLTRAHPNSKYTEDALQRMVDIRNKLGELEVKAARQALAEGQAEAAAKRAEHVVEHYENAPAAPDAYVVMIDAYTALGLTEQALDARRMLRQKHPDYHYTSLTDSVPPEPAPAAVAIEKRSAARRPPTVVAAPAPSRADAPAERAATPVIGSMPQARPTVPAVRAEMRTEDWLLAQRPEQYTLQVLATGNQRALSGFVSRHHIENDSAYFSSMKGAQQWYSLLYGSYDTQADARQAIDALPAALRHARPWIRRYSDIQATIRKERDQQPSATPATVPTQQMPPLPQPDAADTGD